MLVPHYQDQCNYFPKIKRQTKKFREILRDTTSLSFTVSLIKNTACMVQGHPVFQKLRVLPGGTSRATRWCTERVCRERWMSTQRERWTDDACLCARFCASQVSIVCQDCWMSQQSERWADDLSACVWFCMSKVGSVSQKRWMSEQRERLADGACLCLWFCTSKVSHVFCEKS